MGLPPNYRAFVSSNRQDLVHVVYPGFRDNLPVTNLRVSLFPCCFLLVYQACALHIQYTDFLFISHYDVYSFRETYCLGTGVQFSVVTEVQSMPGYPSTPLMAGMFQLTPSGQQSWLTACFSVCCLVSSMFKHSALHWSGQRRASGMGPAAGVSEWWTNTVRHGERPTCPSWASHPT